MKVLLINPSQSRIYERTKIKGGSPYSPPLNLAVLAGGLLKNKHQVRILDGNIFPGRNKLYSVLREFDPEFVGLTFTTALFEEAKEVARTLKSVNPNTVLISGGAHTTALPFETLRELPIDIGVIGEGDFTLPAVIEGKKSAGIVYKSGDEIIKTEQAGYIENLDELPFPAWELFDISRYKTTPLLTRTNPTGWIETSRGCPYNCSYCTKDIFGPKFRKKSAERVIDEISYMLKIGFRELHIADDNFTMDVERAKRICEKILRKGLKFPWATVTGIRIDRVDKELLNLMHKAGCYRVYFGIESGNQEILDNIGKKVTLEKIESVVRDSKKAGLEVFGFFMLALPGETEGSMRDTVKFAKSLPLDMAKVSITIPLPNTPFFNKLEKANAIKTREWGKYNFYFPARLIYQHPNLEWEIVEKYFNRFYREFYLRPGFITRYVRENIFRKDIFEIIKIFLTTRW